MVATYRKGRILGGGVSVITGIYWFVRRRGQEKQDEHNNTKVGRIVPILLVQEMSLCNRRRGSF